MDEMPRAALDPLVVGRVIGDVVDMFIPEAKLAVLYGGREIANGSEVEPSLAAERPSVQITASAKNTTYYTLVMVDPDAPTPTEPTFREWLQWLVVDIPQGQGSDAIQGRELMAYMGPESPTGNHRHRHVFAAFRQEGLTETVRGMPMERRQFNTRRFASQNKLGLPVAALYFNSHKP